MRTIYITIIIISFFSCEKMIIKQEYENNPVDVFESMWKEFDRVYSLFEVKNINWDSIYEVYRPMVNSHTSDDELYNILTSMLSNLNDNHVYLYAPGKEEFRAGILYHLPVFPDSEVELYKSDLEMFLNLIKEKYLKNTFEISVKEATIIYSTIDRSFTGNKKIGYLYINGIHYGDEDIITEAKKYFIGNDLDAVIVDVRFNTGGDDEVTNHIANQFADEKRLFMKSKTRNGIDYNDFDLPMEWYLKPDGETFTKPVILLTNRHTASAAENLTLAMRIMSHVTVLGDTTSGCFSNTLPRELPNGWQYTLSFQLFTDSNGICYEGIGLSPDIAMNNYRVDINNQADKVLENAIDLLK